LDGMVFVSLNNWRSYCSALHAILPIHRTAFVLVFGVAERGFREPVCLALLLRLKNDNLNLTEKLVLRPGFEHKFTSKS